MNLSNVYSNFYLASESSVYRPEQYTMGSVCFKIQDEKTSNKSKTALAKPESKLSLHTQKIHQVIAMGQQIKEKSKKAKSEIIGSQNGVVPSIGNPYPDKSPEDSNETDSEEESTSQNQDDSWEDGKSIPKAVIDMIAPNKGGFETEFVGKILEPLEKPLTKASGSTMEEEYSVCSHEGGSERAEYSPQIAGNLITAESLESPKRVLESLKDIVPLTLACPKSVILPSQKKVAQTRSKLLSLAVSDQNTRKVWSCDMKDLHPANSRPIKF